MADLEAAETSRLTVRPWLGPFLLAAAAILLLAMWSRAVAATLLNDDPGQRAAQASTDATEESSVDSAPWDQLPELDSLSPIEIRDAVRDRLRDEARLRREVRARADANAAPAMAHLAAVLQLCDWHAAVRLDDRLEESPLLQGIAAVARRRLIEVGRDLENRLQRAEIARPPELTERLESAAPHLAAAEDRGPADALARESNSTPSSRFSEGSDSDSGSGDAEASSGQFSADRTSSGRAPAGFPDHGWELVELIQRTIIPEYWETQGGPGVIRYDAMRMALVIRASSHIHEQVGGFLRP